MSDDYMKKLCERSGNIVSSDPLVSFLYTLMRDHLPAGVVEEIIMRDQIFNGCKDFQFTNGWLAEYAKDMAARLK